MKSFAKIILSILTTLNICLITNASCQDIYNEAWKIAKDNFYDSTMNHQDWNFWKKHYQGKINSEEDLEEAISTMLASLDDIYTRYLPPSAFESENSDIHDYSNALYTKPLYYRTRIPKNIKYMRPDSMMNKNLAQQVRDFVSEAEKDKDVVGYIIDLRGDGGGLVKNASDIASIFMDDKIVLYAKTNSRNVKNTTKKESITTKPVVILTNKGTASACEVFTGAMQDNKRAVVIGTTTYGKGVIQQIKKLSDGSGVHITVMSYYTPDFKEINKNGIKPDIEVYFTRKDILFRRDVQLLAAIDFLKKQSQNK